MEDNVIIKTYYCEFCEKEYINPLEADGAGWHEPFLCEAQ